MQKKSLLFIVLLSTIMIISYPISASAFIFDLTKAHAAEETEENANDNSNDDDTVKIPVPEPEPTPVPVPKIEPPKIEVPKVEKEPVKIPVPEVDVENVEVPVPKVKTDDGQGGGCLIATAAYGSELAPQVQLLREIRDGKVMSTSSGAAFMTGFNQLYYSFSPTIADMERENPVFKETVKISLIPMISSLSILNYVDIDSEQEMLGYGIAILLLNSAMYVGIPVFGLVKLYRFKRKE